MLNMKTLLCSTAAIFIVSCANAQDCKYQKIITQKDGEVVTSTTDYNCETKPKIVYKEVEKPIYVYRNAEPIVSESVTYSEPTYYNKPNIVNTIIGTIVNHKINQTLHKNAPIGTVFGYGVTNNVKVGSVSVNYKLHKPGKCYANWETGGTDCY